MADLAISELKTTLATHLIESGQIPTEQELTDSADALVSFFEILIEEDRKSNERQNLRNPDIAD